jgi:hypothetical protein
MGIMFFVSNPATFAASLSSPDPLRESFKTGKTKIGLYLVVVFLWLLQKEDFLSIRS